MKRSARRTIALVMAMLLLFGIMSACDNSGEVKATPDDPVASATVKPSPTADEPEDDPDPEDDTTVSDIPRNETLYFAGLQWGAINGWNPVSSDMNNAVPITVSPGGSRLPMFETLYILDSRKRDDVRLVIGLQNL